jgi:ankyrin repeat protein
MTFLNSLKSFIYQKDKITFFNAVKNGDLDTVKHYINTQFDLELLNAHSETVFIQAVFHDRLDIAKALIKAGANVNLIEPGNNQNAYFCCKSMDMLDLLIESNVNIHLKNRNQMTPLYYFMNQYKFDLAIKCLEKGANPNDIPNSILKATPFKEAFVFEKMVAHGFDYKRVYQLGMIDKSNIQDSLDMFELKEKLENEISEKPIKIKKKI